MQKKWQVCPEVQKKILWVSIQCLLNSHSSAEQVIYLVSWAETWESTGTKEVLLPENTPTSHPTKMWTQLITIKICIPSGTEFVSLQIICIWLNSCWFPEMQSEILNVNWCSLIDYKLLKGRGYFLDLLC